MEQDTIDTQLSVPEAASALRLGHLLLITGSPHLEDAILCQAAQFVNSETIRTFQRLAGPGIYAAIASERYDHLQLTLPTHNWLTQEKSALSISLYTDQEVLPPEIISALTLRALIDPLTHANNLTSPGPIMPLRAQSGGTLARKDYPEGVVDLLYIAGLEPGAAMSKPITHEAYLQLKQANIEHISLESIATYQQEHQVSFISEVLLPTPFATFRLRHYQEFSSRQPYLALVLGDLHATKRAPLVRLHSACLTGDIFGSQRCDCQAQLHASLETIADEGCGLLLYLPQEGRGIGLSAKLQAYLLQEQGYDTLEANTRLGYPIDARDYSSAIEILHELGLQHIRLLTNNPEKVYALQLSKLKVERVPLETPPTVHNLSYLKTKLQRMGHQFSNLQDHLPL